MPQPDRKRIALVGYSPDYFQPFAEALDSAGFDVYWICATNSDALILETQHGIPKGRVLNSIAGLAEENPDSEQCRVSLATLEKVNNLSVYDIIQMDRHLRELPWESSIAYLAHVHRTLRNFLQSNAIELVSSGRDTGLQLTSMLTAGECKIPWIVPTRLRIPKDTYGFCTSHIYDSFLDLREDTLDATVWAERLISDFSSGAQKPALKIAAQNITQTFGLIPTHLSHFVNLLKKSRIDRGNVYSRYSIFKILRMYMSRRLNMASYMLLKPWSKSKGERFLLYALHTQPESSVDVAGSFYSDQVALIKLIARCTPVTHELFVKVHPTDVDGKAFSFYHAINNIPGVRLIHHGEDSRSLLSKAELILTNTGTIGFEAGLLGKPVISFAQNHFNNLPSVHLCTDPIKLGDLIRNILSDPAKTVQAEDVVHAVARYYRWVYSGEVNRNFGNNPKPLNQQDLDVLRRAYNDLYEVLVTKPLTQSGRDNA